MEKTFSAIVVGAGVVGNAIAYELARSGKTVAVIEKNAQSAEEQSLHNSGVIHAGYLVAPKTLKARLCVEGNRLLYDFCENENVHFRKTGCLTIAKTRAEEKYLEKLLKNAEQSKISGVSLLTRSQIAEMIPGLAAKSALFAENVGIVDAIALAKRLEQKTIFIGGKFYFNSKVGAIKFDGSFYTVSTSRGTFKSKVLVNCAGLHADEVSGLLGLKHKIFPVLGEYCFADLNVKMPIYPSVTEENFAGKGVHLTPTLDGRLLAGPTASYAESKSNYSIEQVDVKKMAKGVKYFFPKAKPSLKPAFVGLRAKLSKEGEPERDFIIREESKKGFPGFINLVGIESPGLTASLAIAKYVKKFWQKYL